MGAGRKINIKVKLIEYKDKSTEQVFVVKGLKGYLGAAAACFLLHPDGWHSLTPMLLYRTFPHLNVHLDRTKKLVINPAAQFRLTLHRETYSRLKRASATLPLL